MTTARTAPRSILSPISDALTLAAMLGLTIASATALAAGPTVPNETAVRPLVEAKATPAPVRLPTVIVTGKRVAKT